MRKRSDIKKVCSPGHKEAKDIRINQSSQAILSLPSDIVSCFPEFLTHSDMAAFLVVNKSAAEYSEVFWKEKIKQDFKRIIPETEDRLSYRAIYYQLKAWSQLTDDIKRQFSDDDPALFQSRLSGNLLNIDRSACWRKAVLISNLALVLWLMAERGEQRIKLNCRFDFIYQLRRMYEDRRTLSQERISFQAYMSGNLLALAQWSIAEESREQRLEKFRYFSNFIHVVTDIEKDQRIFVFASIGGQLLALIKDSSDFRDLLGCLKRDQCTSFLKIFRNRLPEITKNASDFINLLISLNSDQCLFVFEALKAQLPWLLGDGSAFSDALMEVSEDQRASLLKAFANRLLKLHELGRQEDFQTELTLFSPALKFKNNPFLKEQLRDTSKGFHMSSERKLEEKLRLPLPPSAVPAALQIIGERSPVNKVISRQSVVPSGRKRTAPQEDTSVKDQKQLVLWLRNDLYEEYYSELLSYLKSRNKHGEYLHWYGRLFGESKSYKFKLVEKLKKWLDGEDPSPLELDTREKNALFRGNLGEISRQEKYQPLMERMLSPPKNSGLGTSARMKCLFSN